MQESACCLHIITYHNVYSVYPDKHRLKSLFQERVTNGTEKDSGYCRRKLLFLAV